MKKLLLSLSVLAVITATSCSKSKDDDKKTNPDDPNGYVLSGNITSDRTLKSGKTYTLEAMVYVKNNATLTIEPGAIIKVPTKGKIALVITRGAKINAVGTATEPIVFTSGTANPSYGDWGGIVMLGKATTNASFNGQAGVGEIEGGVNNSDNDGLYGGTDDNDNSGKLKYVRIEYAGYPFQPDKELNSLTMGGVGAGTEIDYVECAWGGDDAFEMFGGTVNLTHIIAYKTLDDDFDCDNGYRGKVQFAIAIRDKDQADISGANSMEQDNDASGSTTAPITAPVLANITVIGPKQDAGTTIHTNYKRAAHLRRNTRTSIINSVLMGYPTGILIDGSKTATNLINGDMELRGIILAGMSKPLDSTGTTSTGLDLSVIFNAATAGNSIVSTTADAGLENAYGTGDSFNPAAKAGGAAATGGVSGGKLTGAGATATTYRGAVAPGETWYKGWTRY